MELEGTTAVITGSSGRLGSEIVLALALAGCNCICHYHRNREKADKLVKQIQQRGVKAVAAEADFTEPGRIEHLFEKAAELGTPQILINSAAVFSRQPLEKVTFEDAQKVLGLNLIAPVLTSRSEAPIPPILARSG